MNLFVNERPTVDLPPINENTPINVVMYKRMNSCHFNELLVLFLRSKKVEKMTMQTRTPIKTSIRI